MSKKNSILFLVVVTFSVGFALALLNVILERT